MIERIKNYIYLKWAQYRQSRVPVKQTKVPKLVEVQSLNTYIKDIVMKKGHKFWLGNVLYLVKESKRSGWVTLKAIGAKTSSGDIVRGKLHVAHQKRQK